MARSQPVAIPREETVRRDRYRKVAHLRFHFKVIDTCEFNISYQVCSKADKIREQIRNFSRFLASEGFLESIMSRYAKYFSIMQIVERAQPVAFKSYKAALCRAT